MPRIAWLGLVMLIAAGAAYLLLPGPDAPEGAPEAASDGAAEPAPTPPQLEGRPATGTDGGRRPGTAALVTGEVLEDGRGVEATVEAHRVADVHPLRPGQPHLDDRRASMTDLFAAYLGLVGTDPVARAEADATGRFALPRLPPGFYRLHARTAEGHSGAAQLALPVVGLARHVTIPVAAGGAVLRLRILEDGAPVSALAVVRRQDEDEAAATARLDDAGRARWGGLPPPPWIVAFQADDGTVGMRQIQAAPEGELLWEIGGEAVALTGRVVDPEGRGIGGASVSVMAEGGTPDGNVYRTGRADAEGRFALSFPGPGLQVHASAPGHASARVPVGSEDELRIELARLVEVSGRVVQQPGDRPAPGARVVALPLERRGGRGQGQVAMAGADGAFRLALDAPGEVMLLVLGGGFMSPRVGEVERQGYNPLAHDIPAEGLEGVVLEAAAAPRLEGKVVDAAGAPVAGALVTPQCLEAPLDLWRGGMEGLAASASDGRFQLDGLIPGRPYLLRAEAAGHPRGELRDVVVPTEGEPTPIEIRLPAARWLAVTVREAGGGPVAGARIRAEVPREGGSGTDAVPGSWSTGEDGTARVGPLPAGPLGLHVTSAEHVDPAEPYAVPESPTATGPQPVEIVLERGVAITGTVTMPPRSAGASWRSVRVRADVVDGRGRSHDAGVQADGRFRIAGLEPRRYRVVATMWQADGENLRGEAVVEAPADGVTLRLAPSGPPVFSSGSRGDTGAQVPIALRVVLPDGTPLHEGSVSVSTDHASHGTNLRPEMQLAVRRDDGPIWVEVRNLPPTVAEQVGGGRYGPFDAEQTEIVVRLESAVAIAGRVVAPDGTGVGGVLLRAVSADRPLSWHEPFREAVARARTEDDGAFTLGGLRPGSYHLDLGVPSTFVKPLPLRLDAPTAGERIVLASGRDVVVTVQGPAGQPVAGATVQAQGMVDREDGANAPWPTRTVSLVEAQTDARGRAVLHALGEDRRHRLSVRPPEGSGLMPADVEPDAWAGEDHLVQLARAYTARGRVVNADGQGVEGAVVWWQAPGASGASGEHTDAEGRFEIGPQPEPALDVWVQVGSAPLPSGPGTAPPAKRRVDADVQDLVLPVDPGVDLVIEVRGLDDAERGWITPMADGVARRGRQTLRIDPGGRALARHLDPEGTYELVLLGRGDGRYVHETGIRGDAERIVVTARQGRELAGRVAPLPPGVPWPSNVGAGRGHETWTNAAVDDEGRFRFPGLPEGTWRVRAWLSTQEGDSTVAWRGEVEVEAGRRDVVLRLERQPR